MEEMVFGHLRLLIVRFRYGSFGWYVAMARRFLLIDDEERLRGVMAWIIGIQGEGFDVEQADKKSRLAMLETALLLYSPI